MDPVPPYGHRLVVDLYGAAGKVDKPTVVPKPDGKRDIVIAIDPGHGGEDPGATGPGGIREKDVVMHIARRLERKLAAAQGYRPVMVRSGDYYLRHRKRMDLARQAGADLFVSIHADAFKIPSVYGASVYTLSDKGASSETARWLAEKENSSDLIGAVEDASQVSQNTDLLREVLLDVSMNENRSGSIAVGQEILGYLKPVTKLHKKRVEQAGFLVLKSYDVPSVLVETGFISNPAEAQRLNSSAYQEKLAAALDSGIRAYMMAKAPEGTLVAWRREQGGYPYTISNGDTLSEIAVRHGTTSRRLKEVNGLRGDVIRVGQVITIPAGG
jgi:N-acetylmuramoyl-L-alanine amidase